MGTLYSKYIAVTCFFMLFFLGSSNLLYAQNHTENTEAPTEIANVVVGYMTLQGGAEVYDGTKVEPVVAEKTGEVAPKPAPPKPQKRSIEAEDHRKKIAEIEKTSQPAKVHIANPQGGSTATVAYGAQKAGGIVVHSPSIAQQVTTKTVETPLFVYLRTLIFSAEGSARSSILGVHRNKGSPLYFV